jgi:lipopolysaccharide transport system permease protein
MRQAKERINPHLRPRASIDELFATLWRNRQLIWQMTKREVIGRYRGSVLGLAWSFFNPLLMLSVYTFVFSVVFKARWGTSGSADRAGFAIFLFVGMIVHALFSECVNRAPGLILSNVNYVKKVVFPLEILPAVALGSALFHAGISLIVLLAVRLVVDQQLAWTAIFAPLIFLPLCLITLGFAWVLAAIGVYLRDVHQTVGIFTLVLLFLSPVFYPVSALPAEYQIWLRLNPLTFIIEQCRNVLISAQLPDWGHWCGFLMLSMAGAWAGFWWFQKSRKGFADVL